MPHMKTTCLFIFPVLVATACLCSCKTTKQTLGTQAEPKVHAEMFIKSKTPQQGYVYHEAEGKQFYMMPVTEQTFYPGEDSYRSMHHHGVAFESELMAYRIYFDKKQTIDVYAKKTPRMEIAACTWYPDDEQLRQGFGDDILRVSGWIGVGSCKPFNGDKMTHFDDVLARTQRIVENGPLRTVCEVEDSLWLAPDGRRYNITTRYTLYAGHRDVTAEVFVSAPQPVDSLPQLCTGVQNIGADCQAGTYINKNKSTAVTTWGTAYPVNDTVKYGKETVGLAVCVQHPYAGRVTHDKNNQLILLHLQPLSQDASSVTRYPLPLLHRTAGKVYYARYHFTVVAQKENNPPCRTPDEFATFVKEWSKGL